MPPLEIGESMWNIFDGVTGELIGARSDAKEALDYAIKKAEETRHQMTVWIDIVPLELPDEELHDEA